MRTQWQEESLVLAASPVERNQESTKRGRILPSAPIKWVLLRLLGRGRYCRSRVPQPGRRSELPRPNLSEIRAGKELPQAPSLLRGVVAAECVSPEHLELGGRCRRQLPRTSAAGPGVAVI